MEKYFEIVKSLLDDKYIKALVIFVLFLVLAKIAQFLYKIIFSNIVKKTKTKLDDEIIAVFMKPVFNTIVLVGLLSSVKVLGFSKGTNFLIFGILNTIIALIWISSFFKTVSIVLSWLSKRKDKYRFVQKKTLPLFD